MNVTVNTFKQGNGRAPTLDDGVHLEYTLFLCNAEFQEARQHLRENWQFALRDPSVPPFLVNVLLTLQEGEECEMLVPRAVRSDLKWELPEDQDIILEVTLVSISNGSPAVAWSSSSSEVEAEPAVPAAPAAASLSPVSASGFSASAGYPDSDSERRPSLGSDIESHPPKKSIPLDPIREVPAEVDQPAPPVYRQINREFSPTASPEVRGTPPEAPIRGMMSEPCAKEYVYHPQPLGRPVSSPSPVSSPTAPCRRQVSSPSMQRLPEVQFHVLADLPLSRVRVRPQMGDKICLHFKGAYANRPSEVFENTYKREPIVFLLDDRSELPRGFLAVIPRIAVGQSVEVTFAGAYFGSTESLYYQFSLLSVNDPNARLNYPANPPRNSGGNWGRPPFQTAFHSWQRNPQGTQAYVVSHF